MVIYVPLISYLLSSLPVPLARHCEDLVPRSMHARDETRRLHKNYRFVGLALGAEVEHRDCNLGVSISPADIWKFILNLSTHHSLACAHSCY